MRGIPPGGLVLALLAALVVGCGAPAPAASGRQPAGETAGGSGARAAPAQPAVEAAAPAAPRELKVGLVSRIFALMPLWVAAQAGYLAEEGLAIEEIYTSASTAAIAAQVSGTIDLTITSPGNAILTRQKGTNLLIVGGFLNPAMYNLIGQRDLRTIDDVRGKRIGTAGTSTGDALLLREMLASRGMREREDYTFLRIGGTPDRYQALVAGAIETVTLLDPFNYAALAEGYSDLGTAYTYVPDYVHNGTIVDGDWARQHEATVVGFQKALLRGIRWMYEPANADAAIRLAVERTGVERKYAEAALAEHVRITAWPRDGLVSERGLEWV
ncbi:MAG TPA: ABC transporter substrate-binding protein, partial [Chloroflexota bacterium]|nr:ABC transporter substrate-binding protein [Chloroflexota bacterium]